MGRSIARLVTGMGELYNQDINFSSKKVHAVVLKDTQEQIFQKTPSIAEITSKSDYEKQTYQEQKLTNVW